MGDEQVAVQNEAVAVQDEEVAVQDEEAILEDDRIADDIGKHGILLFDQKYHQNYRQDENDSSSSVEDTMAASDDCSIQSIPSHIMRITFDILTHKVTKGTKGKYVAYIIMVMEVPKLDTDRAIIERRYSDFDKLHSGLCKECPKAVCHLSFPKKAYFGANFDESVIENRSRHFEKYLRYIYHQPGVTETKAFRKFFYRIHLKEATQSLKCEEYKDSYEEYRLAYQLQKKLGFDKSEFVVTMCGIVETCKNMKRYKEVEEIGSECLELLQHDVSNSYLLPLIIVVIDARKRLQMNAHILKDKLKDIKRITSELDGIQTLRELLVKLY